MQMTNDFSGSVGGFNFNVDSQDLAALFGGAVGKDTVSRVWRKVQTDWDAWNARSLAEEPIVRLILDGTVVRVRLDRKADVPRVVKEFIEFQGPAVLEVIIDTEAGVYPMVGPGQAYDEMITGDFIASRSAAGSTEPGESEMF
jgi:hypothetical protein